jgi:hypothetical protein
LLGEQTGERIFQCRLRNPSQARWSIEFPPFDNDVQPSLPEPGISEYQIALGVEDVVLSRSDLPFSPYPYAATLKLTLPDAGRTLEWHISILPDVDELWSTPESGAEG